MLSAQCTDERINQVMPVLFDRFPDAESPAAASTDEVFGYIRSVSYPNNKAKHLVGMAQKLLSEFGGVVPERVPELVKLPGVDRKTANIISSGKLAFFLTDGIADCRKNYRIPQVRLSCPIRGKKPI